MVQQNAGHVSNPLGYNYLASVKPPTAYLATIGRKGGQSGRGKSKARTTEQARKAALARWVKRRLESKT